jgi:hypothetical protein
LSHQQQESDMQATIKTVNAWEWVVEDDDGEIIGVFDSEDLAREAARKHTQCGGWDAVVYSRPAK